MNGSATAARMANGATARGGAGGPRWRAVRLGCGGGGAAGPGGGRALVAAANRGVHVAVLAPGKSDSRLTYTASRGHYGPLLTGGVKVFEYQAALMHAKTMVVDGVWATVGSTNFDNRSFALNQELNLTVYDAGFARQLEKIFEEDLKYSKNITYEDWKSRSVFEKMTELFAFPIKEQL